MTKNATGKSLTALSEEESQQLYEWMSKGLIDNFPSLAQEMTKTPKDQKPKDFQGWLQEMVAAGKVLDRNTKLFGDYFTQHTIVKALLVDKEHFFLESIFIDQATLNGTRPVTPVGAEPAVTPSGC